MDCVGHGIAESQTQLRLSFSCIIKFKNKESDTVGVAHYAGCSGGNQSDPDTQALSPSPPRYSRGSCSWPCLKGSPW